MNWRICITGLLAAWVFLMGGTNAPAQIVVVAPATSTLDSLSLRQLRDVFMGKPPFNAPSVPRQVVEYARVSDEFYRILYGATSYAMGKHWLRLIFAGERVIPPKSYSDITRMVAYLRSHGNTIGFIPAEQMKQKISADLKTIVIDGRSYEHPQYLFRKNTLKK